MELICTKGSKKLLERLDGSGIKGATGSLPSECNPYPNKVKKVWYLYYWDKNSHKYFTWDNVNNYNNATEVTNEEFIATVYEYFGKEEKMGLKEDVELEEGMKVYVSDESIEDALKYKDERIYLAKTKNSYLCVATDYEDEYKSGEYFDADSWKYVVPVKNATQKLTLAEVSKRLGYAVEIVEE